jgi:hypothetical protein
MKLFTLLICCALISIGAIGCAAVKGGVSTVRTAVNKALDVADSSINTAEKTFGTALGGTKETVATATTSQP